MKALKEKKVSLRPLIRRGLLILSVLALAFAFAACGGSDDDPPPPNPNGGTPNPNGGPGTVYVYPPQIVQIELSNDFTLSKRVAWQGLPPDLTGAVLDVTQRRRDSNGNWLAIDPVQDRKTVIVNASNINEYITSPVAADWLATNTEFSIMHISNASVQTSNLFRPYVMPINSLHVKKPANFEWFADQRPDLQQEFSLTGEWLYHVFGATITDSEIIKEVRESLPFEFWEMIVPGGYIPMPFESVPGTWTDNRPVLQPRSRNADIKFFPNYPPLDFTAVRPDNVRAYISITVGGSEISLSGGTLATTGNSRTAMVDIDRFWEPRQVTVVRPYPDNFYLRDDEFVGLAPEAILNKLDNLLNNNPVMFEIEYFGEGRTNTGGPTRRINWDEFVANREYNFKRNDWTPVGTGTDYYVAMDPVTDRRSARPYDWQVLETKPDVEDGLPTWTFTMEYVRMYFGTTSPTDPNTFLTRVTPRIPVWQFQGFPADAIERLRNNPMFEERVYQTKQPATSGDQVVDGILQGLGDRYKIFGTYSRGTETRRLEMQFVHPMLSYHQREWWGTSPSDDGVTKGVDVTNNLFEVWTRDFWQVVNQTPPRLLRDHSLKIEWRAPRTDDNHGITTAGNASRLPDAISDAVKVDVVGFNPMPTQGYINNLELVFLVSTGSNLSSSSGATLSDIKFNGFSIMNTLATASSYVVNSAALATSSDVWITLAATPTSSAGGSVGFSEAMWAADARITGSMVYDQVWPLGQASRSDFYIERPVRNVHPTVYNNVVVSSGINSLTGRGAIPASYTRTAAIPFASGPTLGTATDTPGPGREANNFVFRIVQVLY